jgi:hypothetical protein
MNDWETVFETNVLVRVEIVKGVLENEGIEVIVLNKKDSSYLIGTYELKVRQEQALKAINTINNEIKFEQL